MAADFDAQDVVSGAFAAYSGISAWAPFRAQDLAQIAVEAPPAPPPDPVEVLGVSPAGGTIEAGTPVVFDVRSLTALTRVVAMFRFAGFSFCEVAFNGHPTTGTMEPAYSGSSVETISDGLYFRYRFTMRRTGTWPSSPELDVVAFNTDGEEA
jgi:hypothetical protein